MSSNCTACWAMIATAGLSSLLPYLLKQRVIFAAHKHHSAISQLRWKGILTVQKALGPVQKSAPQYTAHASHGRTGPLPRQQPTHAPTCVPAAGPALHSNGVELVEEKHAGGGAAGLVKDLAHLRANQARATQCASSASAHACRPTCHAWRPFITAIRTDSDGHAYQPISTCGLHAVRSRTMPSWQTDAWHTPLPSLPARPASCCPHSTPSAHITMGLARRTYKRVCVPTPRVGQTFSSALLLRHQQRSVSACSACLSHIRSHPAFSRPLWSHPHPISCLISSHAPTVFLGSYHMIPSHLLLSHMIPSSVPPPLLPSHPISYCLI